MSTNDPRLWVRLPEPVKQALDEVSKKESKPGQKRFRNQILIHAFLEYYGRKGYTPTPELEQYINANYNIAEKNRASVSAV